MRGTVMLLERVKVGTASPATPDANCSKTIAMCKACNVPISDRTCPDLALLFCGVQYSTVFVTTYYCYPILNTTHIRRLSLLWTIDMTRCENFGWFQVFVKVLLFHTWESFSLLCCVERWGKIFSISHSRVTECQVEASRSQNRITMWHWELREVSNWRRRRSLACILPWFSLVRNWWDQFLATPRYNARPHSVFARHFLQFLMLDWQHFSSPAQWLIFPSIEHQKEDKNLVILMVYWSMIWPLSFYCVRQLLDFENVLQR